MSVDSFITTILFTTCYWLERRSVYVDSLSRTSKPYWKKTYQY